MFCPGCGTRAVDGDGLCRTCGQSLATPSAAAAPAETAEEHLRPTVVTAPPRPVRARRRLLPIVLRLVSVVGLVSSGIGTWTLLHADASPASAQPPATAQPLAGDPSSAASPSFSPSPVPTSPPVEWASWPTCSNAALGYQIAYVPDWYTTGSTDALTCRFFDKNPLTVTTDSPLPATAIRIYLGGHSYAEEDARYAASKPYVVQRYSVTVEGHKAFAVEAHTTSGQKAFAIIIAFGQDTLVMDTWSESDGDFGSSMSYVLLMSGSLHFLTGTGG